MLRYPKERKTHYQRKLGENFSVGQTCQLDLEWWVKWSWVRKKETGKEGGRWQRGGAWLGGSVGQAGGSREGSNSKAGRDSNDIGWRITKAWRGSMGLEHTSLFGCGRTVCWPFQFGPVTHQSQLFPLPFHLNCTVVCPEPSAIDTQSLILITLNSHFCSP